MKQKTLIMWNACLGILLLTFLAWLGARHPEKEGLNNVLMYSLLGLQAALAVYLVLGYRKKFTNEFENSRKGANDSGE